VATIAGPPSMDEEEISDDEYDSESDDDLADLIDNGENIPPVLGDHLPTSPPSSPLPSLVDPSDSDSDLLLYSSNLPTTTSSIFAPLGLSQNLNFKDKLFFSPQLSSSRNNSLLVAEIGPSSNLNCSTCDKETEYATKLGLDESVFKCDSCMIDDTHSDCGEECGNCKKIAAELDARWIHKNLIQGVTEGEVDNKCLEGESLSILGQKLKAAMQ